MRVMIRCHLDREAGNLAMADGSLPQVLGQVFGLIRPEAAYFLTENGQRSFYAFADLASPELIPQVAEPLFQRLGGSVEFLPVMTQDELAAGSKAWAAAA